MVSSSQRIHVVLLAGLAFALGSCGGGAPPKPTISKASLVAAPDANPDSGGRASPIVVRLYQLAEEGAFANADFFALYDSEQETLGASVIGREEYELKPGETREIEIAVPPEARFIGAIAAFRDIRNARWKAVSATPPQGLTDKDKIKLSVVKSELQLSIAK